MRQSTMLGWQDTSRIVSKLDGRVITAMPVPSRVSQVVISPDKVREILATADAQRDALIRSRQERNPNV